MRPERRCRAAIAALAVATLAGLSACSPAYVVRAAYEEARILSSREPIVDVLARPDGDPDQAEKLRLVLMLREFAARLGLAVGGSYRTVAPIGPDQTIYVLSAAPQFALEPYTWWFPIVGRMPYKGFFSEEDARAAARTLGEEGYDTMVLPVAAFSTLGWFDDPLLTNLLKHDDVSLADVVLHELAHQTYYAPGHAAFNESFASFVGARGAIEFFSQLDGDEAPRTQLARARWHDELLYSAFLGGLMERLREAYARGIDLDQREALFREEQSAFATLPWRTDDFRGLSTVRLNNALLLHQWVYHDDLAAFESTCEEQGGDLARCLGAVIERVRDAPEPYAALR